MNATTKQAGYIANLIKQNKSEYEDLAAIWKLIPRNNEKYPNQVCDYTETILRDHLLSITSKEASRILDGFIGKKDFMGNEVATTQDAINILKKHFNIK